MVTARILKRLADNFTSFQHNREANFLSPSSSAVFPVETPPIYLHLSPPCRTPAVREDPAARSSALCPACADSTATLTGNAQRASQPNRVIVQRLCAVVINHARLIRRQWLVEQWEQ